MHNRFPKWKLAAFALLSICDFAITYLLLSRNNETVYESNPVANLWLARGGWLGLATFKLIVVAAVTAIVVYLYYRRPKVAHDLLAVACGAVVVAVLTGTSIAMTGMTEPEEPPLPFVEGPPPETLDTTMNEYTILLEDASNRLGSREWTLTEAVDSLRSTELAHDSDWLESLGRAYPGLDHRALLAADIIQHTVNSRIRMPKAVELAERLEAEFCELYGVVPVLPYRPLLELAQSQAHKKTPPRGRSLPPMPVPAI